MTMKILVTGAAGFIPPRTCPIEREPMNAEAIAKIKNSRVRESVQQSVDLFPGSVVTVTGSGWDIHVQVREGDWLDLYDSKGIVAHLNTRK